MPAYCSNCNAQVADGAKKCPECGAEFEGEEQEELGHNEQIAQKIPTAYPPQEKSGAIIASALIFIGVGAFDAIFSLIELIRAANTEPGGFLYSRAFVLFFGTLFLAVGATRILLGYALWKSKKIGGIIGISLSALSAVLPFLGIPTSILFGIVTSSGSSIAYIAICAVLAIPAVAIPFGWNSLK